MGHLFARLTMHRAAILTITTIAILLLMTGAAIAAAPVIPTGAVPPPNHAETECAVCHVVAPAPDPGAAPVPVAHLDSNDCSDTVGADDCSDTVEADTPSDDCSDTVEADTPSDDCSDTVGADDCSDDCSDTAEADDADDAGQHESHRAGPAVTEDDPAADAKATDAGSTSHRAKAQRTNRASQIHSSGDSGRGSDNGSSTGSAGHGDSRDAEASDND